MKVIEVLRWFKAAFRGVVPTLDLAQVRRPRPLVVGTEEREELRDLYALGLVWLTLSSFGVRLLLGHQVSYLRDDGE